MLVNGYVFFIHLLELCGKEIGGQFPKIEAFLRCKQLGEACLLKLLETSSSLEVVSRKDRSSFKQFLHLLTMEHRQAASNLLVHPLGRCSS
jgi:hypothetical protein